MWSGPRTVSTAMMRAWENRPDTVVVDEPLYAFYLSSTGLDHPGRDEVIASQPASWRAVLSSLAGDPLPDGVTISYAKHMTHHVLPSVDLAAFAPFRHAFLIRDPRVAARLLRPGPRRADPGRPRAAAAGMAVRGVRRAGHRLRDLLAAPEAALRALCAALGGAVLPAMLSWPPGPRSSDGVWAPHWYDSVWRSTGFVPVTPGPPPALDAALEPLLADCLPYYEKLQKSKIKIDIQNVSS